MPASLIQARNLSMSTPSGRVLFQGLSLQLDKEKVALVGRNGVGKSTLLSILAGQVRPSGGSVEAADPPVLVGQLQNPQTDSEELLDWLSHRPDLGSEANLSSQSDVLSHGQLRRLRLLHARERGGFGRPAGGLGEASPVLLLDEPTQDLDEAGVAWLRDWLSRWPGAALVASHDRSLLQDFEHFFILSESGALYLRGSFQEVKRELEVQEAAHQLNYQRALNKLVEGEQHSEKVARRRARKQRYGRMSEIDRCTSKLTLNMKRGQAQANHGKEKVERAARLDALRQWSRGQRRALQVDLPLELPAPEGWTTSDTPVVEARELQTPGLWGPLQLSLGRQKIGLVGPNGSGKTSLLDILTGRRSPPSGRVRTDYRRLASIAQGGQDWLLEESLLDILGLEDGATLGQHRFPLALAQRPLRSLSPGERVRAALIAIYQRRPQPELLLLDEPTYSLDLPGQRALTRALAAWPGGLLVASHDRQFLREIGVTEWIELSTSGSG